MSQYSRNNVSLLLFSVLFCAAVSLSAQTVIPDTEWRTYGGNLASTRYSSLDQVTADNVTDLDIVWRRPSVDTTVTSR